MIKTETARTLVRRYWPLLALVLPIVFIQLAGSQLADLLRYDRGAILRGQVWRLVSGHFVHLGWTHLMLNIAGLLFLMVGFGARRQPPPPKLFATLGILMLGVGTGLLFSNPELSWYVGLSGVLHGLAVLTALWLCPREKITGLLLFFAVLAKVAWEQLSGADPALGRGIGAAVIVDAHLYGLVSGVVVAFPAFLRRL